MPIQSSAAPDEKSSPFYQKNKELCEQWEQFILEKDGQLNAVYNAWSFDIKAKVKTAHRTWLISVKRATYTNGNLLFSTKWLNKQEIIEFRARYKDVDCPNFRIEPSRWRTQPVNHELCRLIVALIETEQRRKEPMFADFRDGELRFKINHRNDDFELVNRVLRDLDNPT
ncbi:MAG: hypothetical protein ACFHU9_12825 [Fluviicola sp.]